MIETYEPVESLSYKISLKDKQIISILETEMNFYEVDKQIVRYLFSHEDVELDEQGFHECLVIWVDQMIDSDEAIIKRYPEQVEKIHNILDNVRLQQESN